jgi:hypothetical protein
MATNGYRKTHKTPKKLKKNTQNVTRKPSQESVYARETDIPSF